VSVDPEQVRISWAHKGKRAPTVRVLRSDQWFPQRPDDDREGFYGAVRVTEGSAREVVDRWRGDEREAYYSLFTLGESGEPCQAVQVKAWRPDAGQAGRTQPGELATVAGDRRSAPPGTFAREALLIVLPGVFVAGMVSTSLAGGLGYRLALALTFAVIVFWHLREGPDAEPWYFARWLLVPTLLVAFVALGKVAVAGYLWKADPQITFFGAAEIIWFVLRTLAAQGVWMAAAHAWSPRLPRDARARVLVLAAPALAAAAFPQGAVAVAAVTALVLAAREWRFERVE
jgi:hypothetical protein